MYFLMGILLDEKVSKITHRVSEILSENVKKETYHHESGYLPRRRMISKVVLDPEDDPHLENDDGHEQKCSNGQPCVEADNPSDLLELIGEDHEAQENQELSPENLHHLKVTLDPGEEPHETVEENPGEEKGNAKTKGIAHQENDPPANRLLNAGYGQNAGENWPDTRRPAKGEGQTDEK